MRHVCELPYMFTFTLPTSASARPSQRLHYKKYPHIHVGPGLYYSVDCSNTNIYGTSSVKMRKTRHKIVPVDIRILFYSVYIAYTFPVASSLLWNSLPSDIQSSSSPPVFRQRLKHFYSGNHFLILYCDATTPLWSL